MKRILIVTVFAFLSFNLFSQINFDLGDKKTTTESIDLSMVKKVIFKNLLPTGINYNQYSFSIEMVEEVIPAFTGVSPAGDPCPNTGNLTKALTALSNDSNESDVSGHVKNLQNEIKKLDPKKQQACIDKSNLLIEKTTYTKELLFSLKNNETVTVTVKRKFKTTSGTKDTSTVWVKIFKTPSKSPWKIMYGFTFIPNWMNPIANYYCKADTSGKLFTITKLNNQRKDFFKNVSPTLMFTRTPFKKHSGIGILSNDCYQLGFTAGVSLNFASEIGIVNIMAGPSIVISDNISITIGACLTQKDILNGKYKEGDIIKTNLDFDQLHEKKYMPEWFVSLSIRFDQSPFGKKDDTAKK